jgi:demethoxyubiquinone hydroxylase (CLK1/Coq7/Cat5 family)
MLRVDHAGELGAVEIYRGQAWVLRGTTLEPTLRAMQAGEEVHLARLSALLGERRVRPSLLAPLWGAAGFALGVATGLLGRHMAMAATVSVETAISRHYRICCLRLSCRPSRVLSIVVRDLFSIRISFSSFLFLFHIIVPVGSVLI